MKRILILSLITANQTYFTELQQSLQFYMSSSINLTQNGYNLEVVVLGDHTWEMVQGQKNFTQVGSAIFGLRLENFP